MLQLGQKRVPLQTKIYRSEHFLISSFVKEIFSHHDPLARLKWCLTLHGFDGPKKYFWHLAAFLKVLILLGRTIYAYQTLSQPKKLAEMVATYPVRFMSVTKLHVLYIDRDRIRYFYDTVTKEFWDFGIVGHELEKQIKRRFFMVSSTVLCHFSAACFVLLTFVAFPLVEMPEGKRPLPNIIWTPFDTNPSPLYEIIYVVMLWNLFLSILGNAIYDCLFVYCVQHLLVQFKLLKELIRNITVGIMDESSDFDRFNSDYFQNKVFERLKICIEHHTMLLKYGKNLEIFTSRVLVPQLIMSYAVMVINGYIISVDHTDLAKTCGLFNLTASCMVQLGLFAVQASDLKDQTLSVIDSITNTEWHLFKAPIKKALTFMMMNTRKGIVITAGGLANVDNEVLVAVIQKAVSAITLLRALTSEEEGKK